MYHTLTNEKDGRCIQVQFRPFQDKDAPELIRCIRSEYADTYFKRGFYTPETLIRENASGHIRFLTAELSDGGVAGMLALKRFLPREDMCEIASQIFKSEYRGFHMAWPFFQYGMEQIDRMDVSAVYCLPVVFHDITEVLMERIGLMPCGFAFSVFRMDVIHHSYPRDENFKHPQGIMVQPKSKRDGGRIFVPAEHSAFARDIYGSMKADCAPDSTAVPLTGESDLFFENDEIQKSCAIHVDRAGADLAARILAIRAANPEPLQTFNVFLNISDESAVAAYEALTALGFFFAGFQPLCSAREIMVLHDPGSVPLYLDSLALTPRFQRVRDYIKPFYEKRRARE